MHVSAGAEHAGMSRTTHDDVRVYTRKARARRVG